jgi:hypothetical protein
MPLLALVEMENLWKVLKSFDLLFFVYSNIYIYFPLKRSLKLPYAESLFL